MDSGSLTVRPAQTADLPAMLRIAREVPELPEWSPEVFQSMLNGDGSPLDRTILAAVASGEVVGFGVVSTLRSVVPAESEIENLAVSPTWRRRGVGSALLTALLGSARTLGAGVIHLEVRSLSVPAIALYRRAGFERTGRRTAYYRDPVDDAVLMKARLD